MTTYTISVTPNSMSMQLAANSATFVSPLNGSVQTIDRDGMKWVAQLNYINLQTDDRAAMMALIAKVRGQEHRIQVKAFDNPARGNYGGTPVVAGGSQTGNSLNIDGASFTVTDWIKEGDYFAVDVNGSLELKMATADASSDGGGNVTLQFEPKLRASPLDNASVYVATTFTKPSGVFMLSNATNGWDSMPGSSGPLTSLTLNLVEDVFISQS